MKTITTGILAHVDAGKTTCIESMLFESSAIRKKGRVDHQDAFLDYDQQERSRGITIYSKQAGLDWKDVHINVIDTPGHADFSAEMERALSVLDLAVVVISALDGVQSHTKTIWKLLDHYKIPAILFVNKMDITRMSEEELFENLQKELDERAVWPGSEDYLEQAASLDDDLLESFMDGNLSEEMITSAFGQRKLFPVFFGSALKSQGIGELMDGLVHYAPEREYPSQFGARIFKISEDENGAPLYHAKITGGTLNVKDKIEDQKVEQLRLYSGKGFQPVTSISAGQIAALRGLDGYGPGDGLGFETSSARPVLEASLQYDLILPEEADSVTMMAACRLIAMEDPTLNLEYNEQTRTIQVRLMGNIQKEILQKRILEKSGFLVEFSPGKIVYKETIADSVFGYGHFEPLRHYAEVHLLLEPGKKGSGLVYSSRLSRDVLSLNWQRLILSQMQSSFQKGVLTGSPLTDVKITLVAGRAHPKHTSGGDFRQAANRALRQGLMKAENVLLEPFIEFTIQTHSDYVSRVLYSLDNAHASFDMENLDETTIQIKGKGPLRFLANYQAELSAMTKGTGLFFSESAGYEPAVNPEEIIEEIHYDPLSDLRHPAASVFCSSGSSNIVEWMDVEDNLHIPIDTERSSTVIINSGKVSEQELKKVFAQAGGSNQNEKKRPPAPKKKKDLDLSPSDVKVTPSMDTCLIVDGYNMIYSWPELKDLAKVSLHDARERLIDLVVNYQGYMGYSLILVFDGWKRKDNTGSSKRIGSSTIVYTKTGESADEYIEKKVRQLKGKFRIIAATSDFLIQNSVFSQNAVRISARELEMRVEGVNKRAMNDLKSR